MLTYALIASRSGAPLHWTIPRHAGPPDTPELFYWPERHATWTSASGRVAFVGWQATTDVGRIGSHVHVDGGAPAGPDPRANGPDTRANGPDPRAGGPEPPRRPGMTHRDTAAPLRARLPGDLPSGELFAFSGHPLPRDRYWDDGESWAVQFARRVAGRDLADAREDFYGTFTAVRAGRDGAATVVADPLGVGLLYLASGADVTVISNRASVAARAAAGVGGRPARSVEAMGWLPFFGYLMGGDTGHEGVDMVPAGAEVSIDPTGRVEVHRPDRPLWQHPDPDADHDDLVEEAAEDLVNHVRIAAQIPVPLRRLMLSGGKDSRLVLAMMVAAGIADDFEYRTNGYRHTPDCVIAARLAASIGVELDRRPPAHAEVPAPEYARRVRNHVFLTSGMLSAWSLRAAGRWARRLTFGGMFGELLRSHYAKHHHVDTVADLEAFFADEIGFDAAGLLRPEAAAHYRARVWDWVEDQLARGVAPADVPDVFYLRQRMRTWFGVSQELQEIGAPLVNPLQSLRAVRVAFALGAHRRKIDHLHFELVRRLHPPFATIPFAGDTWHEDNWRHLTGRVGSRVAAGGGSHVSAAGFAAMEPLEREPGSPPPPPRWQWANYPRYQPLFEDVVADADNPLFDVIDRDAAAEVVRRQRPLDAQGRVNLFSLLGAALWLSGDEEPARYD